MMVTKNATTDKCTRWIRIIFTALVIVVGIGGSPLSAQALSNDYAWSEVADGDAYPYQSATSSDGQDSIVAGDTAAITHDGGTTWQSLNGTLAAVSGSPSSNWYMGAGMSADGSIVGIIDSKGQLYLSTDGGTTWSRKTTPMTGANTMAMSADGMKLAVANGNSIYISTDGGTTWTQRASGSNAEYVSMSADGTVLIYSDGTAGGIYRSTDDGATWTKDTAGGTLSLYNIRLSANGQIVVAQNYNDDSVYISADSGTTWSQILGAPTSAYNVYLSSDGTTVLVFDGYTRHKSTDHGATWTTQPSNADAWVRGSSGSASADLSVLVGVNDDYGDLFASQDGGATWTVPLLQGGKWWASMATTSDGSTVVLTDADGHIYYSHDHGTTWQFGYDVKDDGDNTGGNLWGSAVSTDGSHMVVSDDSSSGTPHLLTSSDGGVTWTKNTAAGTNDWYDVTLSGDGQKIVAVTKSGVIYTSTNFGTSWTVNSSLQNNFPTTGNSSAQTDVDMSPDGTHLTLTEQGMTSSYNSTTSTWVYTGTSRLYTSSDGGTTWTLQTTPADSGSVGIQDTAMSSDGQTIAFVTIGSSTSVYVSKDGGATWAKDPGSGLPAGGPANQYNQVSVSSDGQVVAVSDFSHNNSYVSTDGGATWITYSNHDSNSTTIGSGIVATAVSGDGTQIYVATNSVYRGALPGTNTGGSTLPSSPQNITATPLSSTDLKVTWQAPASQGSSPITAYRIRYRITGSVNWLSAGETNPSTFTYTIAGLNPTTTYDVQVAAVSTLGSSTDVPGQADDAIVTATTLKLGQTASGGDLADTGSNLWLFGGIGILAVAGGMLALLRFSKR